ncbi:hypothetical protein [Saccharicrinis aurantiacus]|uniref:hypothetical protein n=2 Tax=Saccharicrinis aurantiacus TaxID=1849719 RepID=UPI00094F4C4A|nr:hypothetical protein [Saccharicrinis aurantiacus]
MEHTCLHCNKALIGRSDKKFCDMDCKNKYGNQRTKENDRIIISTNKSLRKNRTILKRLNPIGKSTIRKNILIEMGYDFRFHTHTYTSEKGAKYRFCYEYGCLLIDEEKVLIVNWQTYMKADID